MYRMNPIFMFALMMLGSFSLVVHAQNSPQDFLAAHNQARAEVGVEPVAWNDTIAAFAEDYAKQRWEDCALEHSQGSPYGENIAKGGQLSAKNAVDMWVGEEANYDYCSNSCVGGECGHYLQVVWHDTTDIGCARIKCKNTWVFITCNYWPTGRAGERPY